MDHLGTQLTQKTRLKEFCTASWSDDVLFGVLNEINSWADAAVKEKFIVDFTDNTKADFKKGILAEPHLVWAWQMVKTSDLKQLQATCEKFIKTCEDKWVALEVTTPVSTLTSITPKASYKAFLTKFQTFKGTTRFKLARNFSNVENRSIERFGENNAQGVDLWLKHQTEFETRPYIEQQSYPIESFLTKPNCQPYLSILQAVIKKVPTGDEKCVAACIHPNPKYSAVGLELAVNFKSTVTEGALNVTISPPNGQILGNVTPNASTDFGKYYFGQAETDLHPVFKSRALYMNLIKSTNDRVLWRNLLGTHPAILAQCTTPEEIAAKWTDFLLKIEYANFASAHAEIRCLSALLFKIEKLDRLPIGSFPEERLQEIYMAVKFRKGDRFPRCPCCYHLSKFVNVITED